MAMVRAKAITSMNLQNKHKLSLVKVVSSIWVIDITLYHSHQDSHFGSWSPHPCGHYEPMEKGFYYLLIKDYFMKAYIFCIAKIPRPFDVSKVPFMMPFEALEATYKKFAQMVVVSPWASIFVSIFLKMEAGMKSLHLIHESGMDFESGITKRSWRPPTLYFTLMGIP